MPLDKLYMPNELSQAALALNLEFVADISYNPRTNQYRIELVEPYCFELPKAQNFLILNVKDFTVDKLLSLFESKVVQSYGDKYEAAKGALIRARQSLNEAHGTSPTPSDK